MQLQVRCAGSSTRYVPAHAMFVLAVVAAEQVAPRRTGPAAPLYWIARRLQTARDAEHACEGFGDVVCVPVYRDEEARWASSQGSQMGPATLLRVTWNSRDSR